MDYTAASLTFRIKKVLRYLRLFGPFRTWIKVQGQLHMKKTYQRLPPRTAPPRPGGHVGIVGCGNFAYSNIAYYLRRHYGQVIRTCMDVDIHRAASLGQRYGARTYTDRIEDVFDDPAIDLVFIASNHASHAEYAIQALKAGKAVHVEKPHCVDEDQLQRLCRALAETRGRMALGFNRPGSRFGRIIKQSLESQEHAAMLNWFIAGHAIDPDHWYFREEEGGRVLGNLCHWTDFLYQMVPSGDRFPVTITPTRAARSDCDIAVTYLFASGTIGALTFSAKGHTFEGVRERFAAHRGDVLISMDDFQELTVEIGSHKRRIKSWFRDHGHERRICESYRMSRGDAKGEDVSYVWETGALFLKTKEALERNEKITLSPGSPSPPA